MKRAICFVLIGLVFLAGASALRWGGKYWLIKPSELPRVSIHGDKAKVSFTDNRWPDKRYTLYTNNNLSLDDQEWVYIQWRMDHGWLRDSHGGWYGRGATYPIEGAVYIDPYEKVAIYFTPNGGWLVFGVIVSSVK
jgi:hypothetical protein